NTLGAICLLFGSAALWRFLAFYRNKADATRWRKMIAHGIVLAMVLRLFWIMDSKAATVSFLMGSTLLLAMNSRPVIRRPALVHLLVASMLAISASIVFLGVSPQALQAMGRNPTLTNRTALWADVINLSQNRWIGTGFESFWLGQRLDTLWTKYPWGPGQA